jgi:hypothetical protein
MIEVLICCQRLALDMLGCVFLLGGAAKLSTILRFRESLLYLPYMRTSWTFVIGFMLPPLEVVIGLGLFANAGWAKQAALVLLTCFLGVTLLVLQKRLQIPCHCFGEWSTRAFSTETAGEIALLMGLTLASWSLPSRADLVLGISTALFLLLLYRLGTLTIRNAWVVAQLKQRGNV